MVKIVFVCCLRCVFGVMCRLFELVVGFFDSVNIC